MMIKRAQFLRQPNFSIFARGFLLKSQIKRTFLPFSPIYKQNFNFDLNKRYYAKKKEIIHENNPILHEETAVEEQYQKMSPIEHILLRPDTYVGSIQPTTQNLYFFNEETNKMERKMVTYVPALYKIFDEILVNASDNKQRDKSMSKIRVTIDVENNTITVFNNGKGIPIQKHSKEQIYIPQLIFGNLLTSSNFNDSIQKITGGRNGFGAKLTNIFSSFFEISTSTNGLIYTQQWKNNMNEVSDPIITNIKKTKDSDFTKITFKPDLNKFGMKSLIDDDILDVLKSRVVDIAGCCEGLEVYLNDKILPNSFEKYVSLYYPNSSDDLKKEEEEGEENNQIDKPIFKSIGDRWQIGLGISDNKFQQVSFVNSINTIHGGTHVNYIIDQITEKIASKIAKIDKHLEVVSTHVKQNLFLFINCLIENPTFSSQTKEVLTSKQKDFGSECIIPDRFIKQFMDESSIVDRVLRFVKLKQTSDLNKSPNVTGGRKKYLGIPKLEDALYAGTVKSKECTLILTEGDSAKAFAIAGLSVIGRDRFGVFPLKGKMLNVRDAKIQQITENEEITNIIKILGLNYAKKYDNQCEEGENQIKSLRYGKVMLMTDQDTDGSHIKGLFINFIHHYWPNLLKIGFLEEFITPIVKVTINHSNLKNNLNNENNIENNNKSKQEKKSFYNIPEYNQWKKNYEKEKKSLNNVKIKYYKGLGTNTSEEGKEYFKNLSSHRKQLIWDENCSKSIDLAFNKSKSSERKEWIESKYTKELFFDYSISNSISFSDFIDKELILFSYADLIRSIPSIIDGFKPSQRKVLFSSLKKKTPSLLSNEMKVAQLSGYVSEISSYHHGENSLQSTIISMAQNFIGSNNIPLLLPLGQFGTRLQGGSDHASARYIFTKLNPITRSIFSEFDDPILDYLNDDGIPIEPLYYVPIIPMVLVNGASGIGTGWATNIPCYNPLDLIENINRALNKKELKEMKPHYNGFKGSIEKVSSNQYLVRGKVEITNTKKLHDHLLVSELPIKKWTNSYKEFLDDVMQKKSKSDFQLQKYISNFTDEKIDFKLFLEGDLISKIKDLKTPDGQCLYKLLNLESSLSTNNMHLFDSNQKIKKYNTAEEILEEFLKVRYHYYEKRKNHLLKELTNELNFIENRFKFSKQVISNDLVLFSRSKSDIVSELTQKKFDRFSDSFDYLLNLPLYSFTSERLDKLSEDLIATKKHHEILVNSSVEQMWMQDLSSLHKQLLSNSNLNTNSQQ